MVAPSVEPERFRSNTEPAAWNDLRVRLRSTRWPARATDSGWALGTDMRYLRELVDYWADGFDWMAQEAVLNKLPRFRIAVRGMKIHYVHARAAASGAPALPVVLTHGWPDSFWRYAKVVDMLANPAAYGADPADAFDVVVPDCPGFGYSQRPDSAPLDAIAVADLWAELMIHLGYRRYAAAGGDIGSSVTRFLALNHPQNLAAVHRMDCGLPVFNGDTAELTSDERAWLQDAQRWTASEGAYAAMHRTKPDTAGFGLTDSPAGLAAWIVEKMRAWSGTGDIERSFTRDEVLTNISIYWFTGCIESSMRMYHANAGIASSQHARRVEIPSGFTLFGGDVLPPPRAWLDRVANVARVTAPSGGGHFAPMEDPATYVHELREFFRPYREKALR